MYPPVSRSLIHIKERPSGRRLGSVRVDCNRLCLVQVTRQVIRTLWGSNCPVPLRWVTRSTVT